MKQLVELFCYSEFEGRERLVSVMTHYGLDGPGIEYRWGRDFPHPSRPTLESTRLLYSRYLVSFQGLMRAGRGVDHQPPSSAEVKERVELYLLSPSGFRGLF